MRIQFEVHLQILLAVGLAVFCFGLVLGCIICWRRRKPRFSDIKEEGFYLQSAPTDRVTVTLSSSPSIQILPVKQQYEELDGDVLDYPPESSSFTLSDDDPSSFPQVSTTLKVPPKSRFALRRLSTPSVPCSPFKPTVHGRASLPSIPKLSLVSKSRRTLDRRLTVIGDSFLAVSDPEQSRQQGELCPSEYSSSLSSRRSSFSNKHPPALQFSLLFCPVEGTLTVTIFNVFRGSRRLSSASVRASLPPLCPAALPAVLLRKNSLSLEPQSQVFTLKVGSVEELRACTLRLVVSGKDFSGLRETPLGDLELDCGEMDWEPDTTITYNRQLNPARRRVKKSHTTPESSAITKPLGQLYVLLQYQTQAHRIKVMVRKAESLAKLTRMPGAADHYVVINLRQGGNVIDTKETKGASGPNAVWNAPFLFDLPPGDIIRLPLVLEFIVMQGRLYTKSSVLGRILIGSEGPEAGQQHWREMCSRGQVETTRWHTLLSESP